MAYLGLITHTGMYTGMYTACSNTTDGMITCISGKEFAYVSFMNHIMSCVVFVLFSVVCSAHNLWK